MAFRIRLTPQARDDAFQAYEHIRQVSPIRAETWLRGLFEAIQTLDQMPFRCPLIPEAEKLEVNLRQLLYGQRSGTYRVIYDVQENSPEGQRVRVIRIWRGSRDAVQDEDLEE